MPRRRHAVCLLALAASGAVLLPTAGPALAAAPSQRVSTSVDVTTGSMVRLTADRIPNLATLVPVGAAPSDQRMQVIVGLGTTSEPAAATYLHEISDPASPLYRHYLTPAEYGARFGVAKARTDDVVSRLQAGGMRVDRVTAGGEAFVATGTVAAVESTFGVDEEHYVSNGYDFVANTDGPLTWSADGVFTVIGLDTLQRYLTPGQMKQLAHPGATASDPGAVPTNATAQDLWSLYDQPSSVTGRGQRLSVIGEGDPAVPLADLKQFRTTYGLPAQQVTTTCVDKNAAGQPDCGTDTAGNGEWDIDFQASTAMAPDNAGLEIYFSQSLGDTDLDNAFLAWINDPNGSLQASASEGVCEQTPANSVTDMNTPVNSNETEGTGEALGDNQEPVLHTAFMQVALEGRTMFASTGDTGNTCGAIIVGPVGAGNGVIYNGAPNSVDYPAADAYVTAVGGTEIYPDVTSSTSASCVDDATPTKTPSTMAYPACTEEGWPYSGGGISQYIAEGDYAAIDGVTKVPCLASPDGTTGNTGLNCRSTPDISAQSGGLLDGMDIIGNGAATEGAGTSLAAPMWQGMWARIQSGSTSPQGFGFADETIYKLATNATTDAADFHDVTIGANPLPATTGYDNVTGWGTPDVAHIIRDANVQGVQAVTVPAAPVTAPQAPAAPPAATPPAAAGALAATGLPDGLVAVAVLALVAGAALRRRRA